MICPQITLKQQNTHRLIPSRYPDTGLFDKIAEASDIDILQELEGWTNDRLSAEYGQLHFLPQEEWVFGVPYASVIMAAFCHPSPKGGRFNTSQIGVWYSAFELETAFEETIYHRAQEFLEVGRLEGHYVQMCQYLTDFDDTFHDARNIKHEYQGIYNPNNYKKSHEFSQILRSLNSNGLVYNSVRKENGTCIAVFRPRTIKNVRQGGHYEFRWEGGLRPKIITLSEYQ